MPAAAVPPTPTSSAVTDEDVPAMTYEEARDELVAVVSRLEAGGETLEGSLVLWERGEALARRCQEWLDGARRRLDAARADRSEDTPPTDSPATTTEDDR